MAGSPARASRWPWPLDGVAHSMEMDVLAASDFFVDLGDRCVREGGMTPGFGGSVRHNSMSLRGAGGGSGAYRDLLACCWEPVGDDVGACRSA
jgi:hypothetical protein